MTALRFQTGERHQQSLASLWASWPTLHKAKLWKALKKERKVKPSVEITAFSFTLSPFRHCCDFGTKNKINFNKTGVNGSIEVTYQHAQFETSRFKHTLPVRRTILTVLLSSKHSNYLYWNRILYGEGGSVVRESEFKSERPWVQSPGGAEWGTVFLCLWVNSCADLFVPDPPSCVWHALKFVRALKNIYPSVVKE